MGPHCSFDSEISCELLVQVRAERWLLSHPMAGHPTTQPPACFSPDSTTAQQNSGKLACAQVSMPARDVPDSKATSSDASNLKEGSPDASTDKLPSRCVLL